MELSPEDALRLNVLLANAEAVRIDENSMTVHGLNGEEEMKFPLNPTGRSDQYLKLVRATLSATVLDSPGGYPVFLQRWTRMGQIDHEEMDRLLRLGEPEAVMAVVCSRNLSDELARRAWWCAPWSEHARRMLESRQVVEGEMGKVLAAHLIEHLPFETEPRDMLDTVRLVLQPGLIDEEQKLRLWQSGARNRSYRIGFLEAVPDDLPETQPARPELDEPALKELAMSGNSHALRLQLVFSNAGQSYLAVATDVINHLADQDVASALFNSIGRHFGALAGNDSPYEMTDIITQVDRLMQEDDELVTLLQRIPALEKEIQAMLTLGFISEYLLNPIFSQTDAVGTVMRDKMEPVTRPLLQAISLLRGTGGEKLDTGRRRRR